MLRLSVSLDDIVDFNDENDTAIAFRLSDE